MKRSKSRQNMTTGLWYVPPLDGGCFVLDQAIFNEKELERIGIVCPNCGTESIFDLDKDQTANQDKACPGCGGSEFLKSFTTEVKQNYNFVTYYKRVRDMAKNVEVHLYFKK